MDVTLHVGAHRTGTTTLQACLRKNQGKLRHAGMAVWGPWRTRSRLFEGLICHPEAASSAAKWQARRSAAAVGAAMARLEKEGIRRLVVSEENMIGTQRENLVSGRLYPNAADRLARLGPATAGRRLRVALSIRSQADYWASVLSFCVLRGFALPDAAGLDSLAKQPKRWRDLALAVARVFPGAKIVVWPFETFAGRPERQISMLCARSEIPNLRHRRHWHNASPSRDKLRECLAGAGVDPNRIAPGAGPWRPFNAEQLEAMEAAYASDLAWFQSGGDGTMTFIPDVQTQERWQREERGHSHVEREKRVG